MPGFPFYKQLDSRDCGPACLRMVAKYYGKNFSLQNLREKIHISRQGTSLLGIADAAESIGLKSTGLKISFKQLSKEAPLPCIVHWKQRHFVVVYKISKNGSFFHTSNKKRGQTVFVADPAFGKIKYNEKEFAGHWTNNGSDDTSQGVCLLLNPTPAFSDQDVKADEKTNLRFLLQYIKPYSKYFIQLLLALVFGSLLQLIFPFSLNLW